MISIRVVIVALFMMVTASVMAGPTVVRAKGPSAGLFQPGQKLAGSVVALKVNDSLVVIDEKGTRSFSGPGVFDVTKPSKLAQSVNISNLVLTSGGPRIASPVRRVAPVKRRAQ